MDGDPNDAECTKESCMNVRNNLKMFITRSQRQQSDLQNYSRLQAEYEVIRVKLVATEAHAQDATRKFLESTNAKEIAEADLKQAQSNLDLYRRKVIHLQEEADEAEKHKQQAVHWREKYDSTSRLVEKLDANNTEVKESYKAAVGMLETATKRITTLENQATQLKTANKDHSSKYKKLDKYLKSAIQVIDALANTANLSKQPKNIKDLVDVFRRDDVRFFFNSPAWNGQSTSSDVLNSATGAKTPNARTLSDEEDGEDVEEDNEEEEVDEDDDDDSVIRELEETMMASLKTSAKQPPSEKSDIAPKLRTLNSKKSAPRIIPTKTLKKWPPQIVKPQENTKDHHGVMNPRVVHSKSLPTCDYEAIAQATMTTRNGRKRPHLLASVDAEVPTSSGAGTSGAAAPSSSGTSIHGRKQISVREQQKEMMKKESVKERVARLKAEEAKKHQKDANPVDDKTNPDAPAQTPSASEPIPDVANDLVALEALEAPKKPTASQAALPESLPPTSPEKPAEQPSLKRHKSYNISKESGDDDEPIGRRTRTMSRSSRVTRSRSASRCVAPASSAPPPVVSTTSRASKASETPAKPSLSLLKKQAKQPSIKRHKSYNLSEESEEEDEPIGRRTRTQSRSSLASRSRSVSRCVENVGKSTRATTTKTPSTPSASTIKTRSRSVSRRSSPTRVTPTPTASTRSERARARSMVRGDVEEEELVLSIAPLKTAKASPPIPENETVREMLRRTMKNQQGKLIGKPQERQSRQLKRAAAPPPTDAGPPPRVKMVTSVSAPKKKEKAPEKETETPTLSKSSAQENPQPKPAEKEPANKLTSLEPPKSISHEPNSDKSMNQPKVAEKVPTDRIDEEADHVEISKGLFQDISLSSDSTTSKNDSVQQENDLVQQENDLVQQENDSVPQENDSVHQGNDSVQQENDSLQQENDSVQQVNDSVQQVNDSVQQENDSLQQENDSVQQENDSVQQENDSLQQENDSLQQENDSLQQEEEGRDNQSSQQSAARQLEDLGLNLSFDAEEPYRGYSPVFETDPTTSEAPQFSTSAELVIDESQESLLNTSKASPEDLRRSSRVTEAETIQKTAPEAVSEEPVAPIFPNPVTSTDPSDLAPEDPSDLAPEASVARTPAKAPVFTSKYSEESTSESSESSTLATDDDEVEPVTAVQKDSEDAVESVEKVQESVELAEKPPEAPKLEKPSQAIVPTPLKLEQEEPTPTVKTPATSAEKVEQVPKEAQNIVKAAAVPKPAIEKEEVLKPRVKVPLVPKPVVKVPTNLTVDTSQATSSNSQASTSKSSSHSVQNQAPKSPKQMQMIKYGLDISSESEEEDLQLESAAKTPIAQKEPTSTAARQADFSDDILSGARIPTKKIISPKKAVVPKPAPTKTSSSESSQSASKAAPEDDLADDILAGAKMPTQKRVAALKKAPSSSLPKKRAATSTNSESASPTLAPPARKQPTAARMPKVPIIDAPPAPKRTRAVPAESRAKKSTPPPAEPTSSTPGGSEEVIPSTTSEATIDEKDGKKKSILIEPRRRGRTPKSEKTDKPTGMKEMTERNKEVSHKKAEKVANVGKATLRQALDLKVPVHELKRPMEEKGIVLEESIPLSPSDAVDVMIEFLRQSSAGDMWAVLKKQRVDGNLMQLVNSEEETFLNVSVSLIVEHEKLLELFIERVIAEFARRDDVDSKQCGRLTRLFCHAIRFAEADEDQKTEWMQRFVMILFHKHEHQLTKSLAYCLISDSAEFCRWLIEDIDEPSGFSIAFRAFMHMEPEQAGVVNWLLNAKFQYAYIPAPTAAEIKKAFVEARQKFIESSGSDASATKTSIYLAKTGTSECLEVVFDHLKRQMTSLQKHIIEAHEKDKELKHKTVFAVPTITTKLTAVEATTLQREFQWMKIVMLVMINNPHTNHYKAIFEALKQIAPQIVALREVLLSSNLEQLVEPSAITPLQDAIENLSQIVSDYTNFPLKTSLLSTPPAPSVPVSVE